MSAENKATRPIQELRERLQGVPVATLSKASGVSRGAIRDIRDGHCTNPRIETFDSLVEALDHLDGEPALEKSA